MNIFCLLLPPVLTRRVFLYSLKPGTNSIGHFWRITSSNSEGWKVNLFMTIFEIRMHTSTRHTTKHFICRSTDSVNPLFKQAMAKAHIKRCDVRNSNKISCYQTKCFKYGMGKAYLMLCSAWKAVIRRDWFVLISENNRHQMKRFYRPEGVRGSGRGSVVLTICVGSDMSLESLP